MIDLGTLKRIAKTKGINNIGFAEKDYFQEIIMLGISREAPDLVFKGGTALYKLHGLNRFSEDLDFSGKIDKTTVRRISGYIKDFGYETDFLIKTMKTGTLLTFITQGFLYHGTPESKARIQMDVSRTSINLDPNWHQFFSLYPDIPSFKLKAMALEEILTEKVRALLVRNKARDAYDIWYLLSKGIRVDVFLIRQKLELYNLKLDKSTLNAALKVCKEGWNRELKAFLIEVPVFMDIKQRIEDILLGSS